MTLSQYILGIFFTCISRRCEGQNACCFYSISIFAFVSLLYACLNAWNLYEFTMLLFKNGEDTSFAKYENYNKCAPAYVFYIALCINALYSLGLIFVTFKAVCCPGDRKAKHDFDSVNDAEDDDNAVLIQNA